MICHKEEPLTPLSNTKKYKFPQKMYYIRQSGFLEAPLVRRRTASLKKIFFDLENFKQVSGAMSIYKIKQFPWRTFIKIVSPS